MNIIKNISNLILEIVSILKSKQQISIEEINSLNLKLPKDYINFLLKNNGGYPSDSEIDIITNGKKSTESVNYFLSINSKKYSDLVTYIKVYTNRIPINTIPFAYDSFGNLFLIDLKTEKIYFWVHDINENEKYVNNLGFVANNFTEFLNKLHVTKDEGYSFDPPIPKK